MTKLLAAFALVASLAGTVSAQGIYATLTGVVSDPSKALVTQAKVILKDAQSGSQRETVTNSDGYFTFASVPVGSYELSVEAKGFTTYKLTGITLNGGDKRNVDAQLTVGTTAETVNVSSGIDLVTPVDSGEKSAIITSKELQNFVSVGSNAAEFIKIMPGFGISNGTSNKSNFSGETMGINANGDAGSQSPLNNAFSYNGLPGNSLDITADGAHVSDPGCNCDTPVNPNSDMIAELQVKTSNFSAENQKGPAVVTSVAKSGGREFHGSGFFYARNYAMNANDALFNASGQTRPENKYYYPGFTVGGPVLLPGGFNKKRNKLFFFTGLEYFYQVLDTGLLRATVPTTGMIGGNFSPAEVAKEGNITASGGPPGQLNAAALALAPGGIMPASLVDKNMQALANLFPRANADSNATGGFNYVSAQTFNQNNTQWMSRVDYSISDNTKLFVRYNLQRETQQFPVGLWWRNGGQVPYPTPVQGKNRSDSVSASLTHVFNPSMTNEFVFGYTFIGFPNVFEDPSKVDRAKVGYNYKGLFKNGVAQIPSFGGWGGGEAALVFNPGGFEAGGASAGLYANKYMPSASDTVIKVVGTHTIKAGAFWEWIRNAQPANNNTNGFLEFNVGNPNTLGNAYADLISGTVNSYQETSFNRINDIAYSTYEGFVQDSWKVNRRLTLELGLRATHFQPWVDRLGFGYSIFDYSKYSSSCTPLQYCGFVWHKRDENVPLGGFPTRALFWQPRVGFAYDIRGSGKTVLRGGWGRYYYHSGQFTNGLDVSAGVVSRSLGANVNGVPVLARNLDTLNVADQASGPSAVDNKNDRQPYTDSYSFTISQRLPWASLAEFAYVGNRSRDLGMTAGAGSNINLVPVGAMLNRGADPNSLTADDFRPLKGFSNLNLATNKGYANYNALQVTWVRTKGRYTVNANYTFGKAMGILYANGGPTYDQFNIDNNYGVQSSNRTHIFNVAYSIELGNFVKGKAAGGFVNGWQLSGIMQAQSGPNLSALSSNGNFNMSLNSAKIPGTDYNISNVSLFGTNNIQLNPMLTCDPSQGLATNQFINLNCFAMPTRPGQNGPTVLPAIYGPAFFNMDLGLFKNFQISEAKKVQIRFNGYNFLNHPLWSFNGSNLNLGFDAATGKVNTPLFGTVTSKQGHRVVQMAVKFYF
jgi:hypothetical protein